MYLHTLADYSMVFPSTPSDHKYYRLKSGFIEYSESSGKMLIQRINSTDPSDYLNTAYTLGGEIK